MEDKVKRNQYSAHNSTRVKARANYTCEECGSTEMVQAHAPDKDHTDWRKGVCLCASCHSDKHPNVPRSLFFTKNHQPYWNNISAHDVAKRIGCHNRTVIRQAKKLGIKSQTDISDEDIERIRQSFSPHREREAGIPVVRVNQLAQLCCKRCGHTWSPRVEVARICPHCKSAYWDTDRIKGRRSNQ